MTTSTQTTPVKWEDDVLVLLDQTRLPVETIYLQLTTAEQVWGSIRRLEVRGAPAIGMAAAYGLYLGIRGSEAQTYEQFWQELNSQADYLGTSRPTAVNLFWALDRIKARVQQNSALPVDELKKAVLDEALAIQKEDAEVCRTIGEHLLTLLQDGMGVLTHCNPGALATAAYGTATAPFYLAKERGWDLKVYADETRPVLQGARLTAYELQQAGIDVTLICDNMAAMVMSQGKVQAVVVGTDRVAANGDVANKIGTYGVAVLAKAHGIPFYVAAPLSSVDLATATGAEIPIEERPAEEITHGLGKQVAPDDIKVYNPAFDVTPAQYITAIVTETGIFKPEEIAKSKQ
ncbi:MULTISPECIES: S-methyl-5-thioribose-1-phosphate isomerase [Brevibacillus]|jgi:methylthioribose-1-phosphate isomerase|uniref:S-methyl-5-thioribose-1-phosphate isomerase n=1 Tax=Brevibacillus TaxID=55080 RepID=UPI000EBDD786|nr:MULTISPECIES: S-methyl-5-thioribose-1-phosphate isomerase [Brevibacillus]MBU8713951.1 S-methyl-5-thioribose-1-phosphate isomerase [Brevibacillus parabrevis]MDH6350589.1 methylthioribose-1-phosphate isomerase [Brevibacillus sp. 1238]MDR4998360.1 S-methyl-5-thioribose-1-phosphate isomerase [Brevibacillus parabrevis]MED1723033.1 S-methyl-5-thioribose-1-phosphate isomerase [Brevibacillus parabrevis]MED2255510.1 S-methyl-5-thioribose-1-phosphate isomerase [Brevibacillus parabrevis]